ncbi:MAG: MBL fold metallo-hydrolase [Sediminicola sp.]
MKNAATTFLILGTLLLGCKDSPKNNDTAIKENSTPEMKETEDIEVIPIEHASAILQWGKNTVYIDPVGGAGAFAGQNAPNIILITDIHGDHFSLETLQELNTANSTIVVPQAVADEFPEDSTFDLVILDNGETKEFGEIGVEAIPMYNLREEATQFHTKGRGNGYVLTMGEKKVYFSGDTEDIPEMRQLENIDMAFVCMNLPYTMTVESAADAVLEFAPKQVYPYHYRGKPEVSDVANFKTMVNTGNPEIEVVQLDWYPKEDY